VKRHEIAFSVTTSFVTDSRENLPKDFLDITHVLLSSVMLQIYIQDFSVTGLTSNRTDFANALKNSHDFDEAIHRNLKEGKSGEALFIEPALEDLKRLRHI
jgi:hypothetical protein